MGIDRDDEARQHVARLLADLSRPEAYPMPVDTVDIEETHISIVFLAGDLVFKVKKPVDFGFLDFTTLERRHHFCREEVRLNRRLTRDVYLGVVPVIEAGGQLQLTSDGPVVDYAVQMRRLPHDRMLLRMLGRGEVTEPLLDVLAERLTQFYCREAATGPGVDEWGTAEAVWHNIRENLDQTARYAGEIIAPVQLRWIEEVSSNFLWSEAALLAQRVASGRIREGHGDLHLAHVFVERPEPDGLQIVDCIEFNPRLRCGDVATDIAFLAMDLDHHGRSDLAVRLVASMAEQLDDAAFARLVHFFSIYRAHVRAKVSCFRTDELAPELPEYLAVRTQAERYIDLATSYLVEPERPTLFLVGGLAGTGKSVLARRLARALGAQLASSDVVRKELAGVPVERRRPVPFGEGIYGQELTVATYEALLARADQELSAGRSVVLDATFLDHAWRERARRLAVSRSAGVVLIECRCPPDVVYQRLLYRAQEPGQVSEATWTIYQEQRARYGTTFTEVAQLPHLVVETDRPSAMVLHDVLCQLSLRWRL
jgi:aminoglycoside phosphotransferase family enzyme/predicted kinase